MATGLGLMPWRLGSQEQTNELRKICDLYDAFEVRDIDSKKALAVPSVKFGLDDCFLSPGLQIREDSHKTLHICIALANLMDLSNKLRLIKDTVAQRHNFDAVICWVCGPTDFIQIPILKSEIPDIKIIDIKTMLSKNFYVGPEDKLITTRFHPHLMFARTGLGGVYYSSTPYYNCKHGSIMNLGSEFTLYDDLSGLFKNIDRHASKDKDIFRHQKKIRNCKAVLCLTDVAKVIVLFQ